MGSRILEAGKGWAVSLAKLYLHCQGWGGQWKDGQAGNGKQAARGMPGGLRQLSIGLRLRS